MAGLPTEYKQSGAFGTADSKRADFALSFPLHNSLFHSPPFGAGTGCRGGQKLAASSTPRISSDSGCRHHRCATTLTFRSGRSLVRGLPWRRSRREYQAYSATAPVGTLRSARRFDQRMREVWHASIRASRQLPALLPAFPRNIRFYMLRRKEAINAWLAVITHV